MRRVPRSKSNQLLMKLSYLTHCRALIRRNDIELSKLSKEERSTMELHLPKNQPGARGVDDRRVIRASSTLRRLVAAGVIAWPLMTHRRRSIIAQPVDGRNEAPG